MAAPEVGEETLSGHGWKTLWGWRSSPRIADPRQLGNSTPGLDLAALEGILFENLLLAPLHRKLPAMYIL